ncbi:MAG TPA: D-aminoacyl-tRNA deacylase [Parasegetibacter sp.]
MRAVIQRVSQASVTVVDNVTGAIRNGLLILVGMEDADTDEDITWLSSKIVGLRIFNDEAGLMNLSIKDINGDILLVSQFTLHASTKKGNRPSFIKAAKPPVAIPLYEKLIRQLEADLGKQVQTGIFGADMKVSLLNDGPVTIIIDTKDRQ